MICRALGMVSASCVVLGLVSGCSGGPPEVPGSVTSVTGRHDHEGKEVELALDKEQLLACLKTSRSLGEGEAQKCVIEDGDYTVVVNGDMILNVHSATQFTVDHQGFFANECLFPMLFKAAHGTDPAPGGC
ncbi:MAG: hypothetical protein R3B70_29220 [Polyangiaceae bacterium]